MLDAAPRIADFGALMALYAACLATGFGLKYALRRSPRFAAKPIRSDARQEPSTAVFSQGPGIARKFKAFFLFQTALMTLAFWSIPGLAVLFLILFAFAVREILRLRSGETYPAGYGFRPIPAYGLLVLSGLSLAGYLGFAAKITGAMPPPRGLPLLAFIFLLVAVADGYAQITGQILGGPKIVPRLSQGKTWSGFFGSLFFCALASWSGDHYFFGYIPEAGPAYATDVLAAVFGVFVASLAFLGDISASWVKRRMGLKDFSNLLGPQGGILDRIDSLLWLGPALWLAAAVGLER
ncbi:MAG: phosphatidate cytidylyltransferase [Fibrobacteria bacterium]